MGCLAALGDRLAPSAVAPLHHLTFGCEEILTKLSTVVGGIHSGVQVRVKKKINFQQKKIKLNFLQFVAYRRNWAFYNDFNKFNIFNFREVIWIKVIDE